MKWASKATTPVLLVVGKLLKRNKELEARVARRQDACGQESRPDCRPGVLSARPMLDLLAARPVTTSTAHLRDLLEVEGIRPAYLLNWDHSQLGFEGTHHKRFVNMAVQRDGE